ncbi:MAG TPA: hypothetical protein VG013_16540 [Gemmataceae bacterium]|nr:hypothetical protein [Gemmataceae bacterium]
MQIRNRIKCHRKVRAGDLVPHELNYRFHPEHQRAALGALYQEIGFARSLLAYELPGGKLKLIDGHLRRDMDPDMEVDVEVLDLTDEEARVLLLSIDPLADLALVQDQIHERLMDVTPTDSTELAALWKEAQETIDSALEENSKKDRSPSCELDQHFMVLIPCRDEKHQAELLDRFQREGLACKAVLG